MIPHSILFCRTRTISSALSQSPPSPGQGAVGRAGEPDERPPLAQAGRLQPEGVRAGRPGARTPPASRPKPGAVVRGSGRLLPPTTGKLPGVVASWHDTLLDHTLAPPARRKFAISSFRNSGIFEASPFRRVTVDLSFQNPAIPRFRDLTIPPPPRPPKGWRPAGADSEDPDAAEAADHEDGGVRGADTHHPGEGEGVRRAKEHPCPPART